MLKYLRLTRAHTAPLEAAPAMVGAALAEGTLWSLSVALWGIAGILYHLAGYGQNSYEDWKRGYDQDDPFKQHHPLNRGALSPKKAKYFIWSLLIITVVYVSVLAYPSNTAQLFVILGIVAGIAYNTIGKLTQFKFILISIAHTTIFIIPYASLGGDIYNVIFLSGVFYMFLWIVFQISVSGEIKDIIQDESNFLRNLGSYVKPYRGDSKDWELIISTYSKHYAYSIKLLTVLTGFAIAAMLNSILGVIALVVIGSMILMNITVNMMQTGDWNREKRITQMSLIEAATAMLFIVAYWKVIGPLAVLALVVGSMVWAVTFNKLLWSTYMSPRV